VSVDSVSERTFLMHLGGKIEVDPKVPVKNHDELSTAVSTMAPEAVVFAMANPGPQVRPEEVRDDVAIMATARSDCPNQINNVLARRLPWRPGCPRKRDQRREEARRGPGDRQRHPDEALHTEYSPGQVTSSVCASRPLAAAMARREGASTSVRSASSTTASMIAASSSGLPASRS
jgi:hypothetical protein